MVFNSPKVRERHALIMEKLTRDGMVRVSQLSQELDTTVVTIRHDLTSLERPRSQVSPEFLRIRQEIASNEELTLE